MVAYDLALGVKDTHATITWNIKDEDEAVVDLTNATTVDFVAIQDPTWRQEKAMVISDAANGVVTVQLNAGMLRAGINVCHGEINWATGKTSYTVEPQYRILGLRI